MPIKMYSCIIPLLSNPSLPESTGKVEEKRKPFFTCRHFRTLNAFINWSSKHFVVDADEDGRGSIVSVIFDESGRVRDESIVQLPFVRHV
ncbi:hypothetical protein NPIL_268801 [Nephila pilipes]|uniref:Uncharacterized protein n=1 Tax=Nephila pilipes TaxID=299642 RepID=A0A8X6NKA1_NEPPI|nr:hypothetical protein NPIL_268801 [Nephila pilipes]